MAAEGVDLVYMWVDGSDPEWQQLRRKFMSPLQLAAGSDDEQWGDDKRYLQMEEIVYAVRSARRFAPWIRDIYVVITDGQKLPAAVLNVPQVHVVPYSTIMPAELLPTFCSPSIEPFLHKISGLSEVFLYGNDDYLFWKPTHREYFIQGGQLRLRGYLQPRSLARRGVSRQQGHMKIANRSACLLYSRGFRRVYMPEHSYHVFRKSTCEAVWHELQGELWAAVQPKFRDDNVALFWQLLVYAYEDRLHRPIHEFTFEKAHLSFHSIEQRPLMRAYVMARLVLLSCFPLPTVCFNSIPPSWHDTMRSYFAMHMDGDAGPAKVVELLRSRRIIDIPRDGISQKKRDT